MEIKSQDRKEGYVINKNTKIEKIGILNGLYENTILLKEKDLEIAYLSLIHKIKLKDFLNNNRKIKFNLSIVEFFHIENFPLEERSKLGQETILGRPMVPVQVWEKRYSTPNIGDFLESDIVRKDFLHGTNTALPRSLMQKILEPVFTELNKDLYHLAQVYCSK